MEASERGERVAAVLEGIVRNEGAGAATRVEAARWLLEHERWLAGRERFGLPARVPDDAPVGPVHGRYRSAGEIREGFDRRVDSIERDGEVFCWDPVVGRWTCERTLKWADPPLPAPDGAAA